MWFLGFAAVLGQVTLSGFAGVYFERVLKSKGQSGNLSIWDRNVQLAFFSMVLYGTPLAMCARAARPPARHAVFARLHDGGAQAQGLA